MLRALTIKFRKLLDNFIHLKRVFFIFFIAAISFPVFAQIGQNLEGKVRPVELVHVSGREWFKDRSVIYFVNEFYIIDNRKVRGTPFLYRNWYSGTVTTAKGDSYSNYKLKYNAFNQTIFFSNGLDSLEVNEDVKEFTLVVQENNPSPDTVFRFINGSQFKNNKDKTTNYYEILLESEKGKLLKLNKKGIVEESTGLPSAEGTMVFMLETSFYYYDINAAKFSRIKSNGSNIADILKLDKETEKSLMPDSYDLTQESQLIELFKKFFQKKPF